MFQERAEDALVWFGHPRLGVAVVERRGVSCMLWRLDWRSLGRFGTLQDTFLRKEDIEYEIRPRLTIGDG